MQMPNKSYIANTLLVSRLEKVLKEIKDPIVAVSGGVDSMTLSSFAHKLLGYGNVCMVHAISPAVPESATKRTRTLAEQEGWDIDYIDGGEFSDPQYIRNPVNRCFFCKSNLYGSLSKILDGTIISGTNLDDLEDYRPGLQAAKIYKVRHPYVEARFRKSDLRNLAAEIGLGSIAALPASPCLSSRVETGTAIQPNDLRAIDKIESWVKDNFTPDTVRCRTLSNKVCIELDKCALERLSLSEKKKIQNEVHKKFSKVRFPRVMIKRYVKGSAFVSSRDEVSHD